MRLSLRVLRWTSASSLVGVWAFALLALADTSHWPRGWRLDFSGSDIRSIADSPDGLPWRIAGLFVSALLLASFCTLICARVLPWIHRRVGSTFGSRERWLLFGGLCALAASLCTEPIHGTLEWLD